MQRSKLNSFLSVMRVIPPPSNGIAIGLLAYTLLISFHIGKHGKIDPVGTDEIDPVKTA